MHKFFISVVASALLMPAAHGQPAPADLRALFDAAWERSVAFQATEGRRLEAAASRVQADSLIAGPPTLGLLLMATNEEHRQLMLGETLGLQMMAGAAILQGIGTLIIRKIVNIPY